MKDQPSRSRVAAFFVCQPLPQGEGDRVSGGEGPLHARQSARHSFRGCEKYFKKVLTGTTEACIIYQVGGRQREHSTAGNGFLGKFFRKENKKVLDKELTARYHIEADSQKPFTKRAERIAGVL